MHMQIPEYLLLFQNTGDVKVTVKFKDRSQSVRGFMINWQDVERLFDPETGKPFTVMTFDEHPFEIEKIEIKPIEKALTIVTK